MANSITHHHLTCVRKARHTIVIPFLDADGDPTDPTSPDSRISVDGAALANCAEEVTVIGNGGGTGAGLGFLTLSGAETDCGSAALWIGGTGVKPTLVIVAPLNMPVLLTGTATAGGASSITLAAGFVAIAKLLAGCWIKTTGGTGGGGTGGANNQARMILACSDAGVITTDRPWATAPDGTTTYEVLVPEPMFAALAQFAASHFDASTNPAEVYLPDGSVAYEITLDVDAAAEPVTTATPS